MPNKNNDMDQSTHYHIQVFGTGSRFAATAAQSLLVCMEQAQKSDIYVGCRGGGCGKCRIQVLKGNFQSKKMSRAHIQPEDETNGIVLACRIFAQSDLIIKPVPFEDK